MEDNKTEIFKEITSNEPLLSDDLSDTSLNRKDKKTQLNELIELGRSKGKLTTQEIMDALETVDFDPEQMDKLYEALEGLNVEVVDDFSEAAFNDPDFALDSPETDLSDEACAVMEARLKEYGVRNYKVEKESAELIKVTTPFYSEAEVLGTMLSAGGQFTFTDANGNELLTNEDFTSTDVLYANGYYYLEMNADKADIKAATEATAGSTMPIILDGQQLAAPQVDEVTTQGKITLSFGMSEAYTRALAAMLVSDPMPVG